MKYLQPLLFWFYLCLLLASPMYGVMGDEVFGGTRVGVRDCDVGDWEKWYQRFSVEARNLLIDSEFWEETQIKRPSDLNQISVKPRIIGGEVIMGEPVSMYGLLLFEFVLVEIRVGGSLGHLRLFHRGRFDKDNKWNYINYPGGLPLVELTDQSDPKRKDVVGPGRFDLERVFDFLASFELLPKDPPNSRQWVSHFMVIQKQNDKSILGAESEEDVITRLRRFVRDEM